MSWGKDKRPDRKALDKMSNEMLKVNKCTATPDCKYRPKNFTDYVKHLEKEHPEGGKATGW